MKSLLKYLNVFEDTILMANQKLVNLIALALLLSFQILTLTNQKPHYILVVLVCILLLIINFNGYINYIKLLYFIPLLVSVFFYLSQNSPDNPFILSILNYLIIPMVFLNHNFQDFDFSSTMKLFQGFTVVCFFGLLLQVIGIESPFLDLELAITNDVVKERYGSFAGSTLVLGFYTSISTIYSFYNYVYKKDSSIQNIILFCISIISLFLAQSRRYYIFSFIIMFLIYFLGNSNITNPFKIVFKNKIVILAMVSLIVITYFLQDKAFLLMRFYSTFDFANDGSNVLRAIKWLEAIEQFLENFWFGAGLGDMGAVGKNLQELSVYELSVAESYFLKVFVEGGIFFGSAFIIMMIYLLIRSFKFIRRSPSQSFAAYIFIFFFLDCFMSMTMEYVLGSILFWLSISVITKDVLTLHSSKESLN